MADTFRLPPPLDVTEWNVSENYNEWKRQVLIYLTASGALEKDNAVPTAIILNCAGPQVVDIYDNFNGQKQTMKINLTKCLKNMKPTESQERIRYYTRRHINNILLKFE